VAIRVHKVKELGILPLTYAVGIDRKAGHGVIVKLCTPHGKVGA
jgi:hypothetical protein